MQHSLAQRIASVVVAVATPIVIVGVSIVVFLNPVWVGFEQDRSGVDQITGYTPAEVRQVTGSILHDLLIGPPAFDASVNGQPVLDVKEREHMVDVRNVFVRLGLLALAALIALVALGAWSRGAAWFWRAVSFGARVLAVAVVAVGIFFGLFFDTAFTILHELFFAAGSWTFNGQTERLVQLFPDQFWFETSLAVIVVVMALAIGLAVLGHVRGRDELAPAALRRTVS